MKKEYIGQVSGIKEIKEQVGEYGKEGYRVMYVGKTNKIEERLKEYKSGIGGESSTAPALLRSIVGSINELFPFDNILRTYINTGFFLYAQSDRASELEKELIEELKPELNTRKGDRREAKYVYLFMHKESPVEFIERNFPRLKDFKRYIIKAGKVYATGSASIAESYSP